MHMSRFSFTRSCVFGLVLHSGLFANGQQQPLRSPQQPQTATQQTATQRQDFNQNAPTVQIPIMTTADAIAAGVAQTPPQAPFGPLNPQHQNYLDKVLQIWEERTAKVNQFQCEFKRWEFDPGTHPSAAKSIAAGIIKFAKPDKALFRVDKIVFIENPSAAQPAYIANPRLEFGDFWICDGQWVHAIDRNQKKAVRTELPQEMRGNQIHLSPIPFLFGVKADELKQRYWLRPIAPPAGNKDVWIEAFPKRADDAGNYSRVEIVLDATELLPKALTVFYPGATELKPHREVYEFDKRDQMDGIWNKVQGMFMKDFIDTKLPADWQVIEEPVEAQVATMAAQQAAMQQAAQQQLRAQQQPNTQPGNRTATPGSALNR
jgi:TIGR03009 family protein